MQAAASDGGPLPTFSLDGLRAGAAAMLAALPGVFVFSAAFGALAAQKGLTLAEAVLMSTVVFAGVSQFVSMEIWSAAFTPALVATLALTTLLVNLRMVLMGATLQPWIAAAPRWQVYPSLLLLTDNNWVVSMRYRGGGGADVGYLFGSGFVLFLIWVPATAFGQVFGSLLDDPRRYGVDLILPLFLVAIIAPMLERSRRILPWVIAGLVAALVQQLLPGFLYIVAGALAGAIAGGVIGDE